MPGTSTMCDLFREALRRFKRSELTDDECEKFISFPKYADTSLSSASDGHDSRPNVLPTYRGSFNPPHVGHLETLMFGRSEYFNCTAALVIPRPNRAVERKARKGTFDLVLSQITRAALWEDEAHQRKLDWVYVWKDDNDTSCAFLQIVREIARNKILDLDIISLMGSDLYTASPRNYGYLTKKIYLERNGGGLVGGVLEEKEKHSGWLRVDPEALENEYLSDAEYDEDDEDDDDTKVWRTRELLDTINRQVHPRRMTFWVNRSALLTPLIREMSSSTVRDVIIEWEQGRDTRARRRRLTECVIRATLLVEYLNMRRIDNGPEIRRKLRF